METPFSLIHKTLMPHFKPELDQSEVGQEEFCGCCQRHVEEWESSTGYSFTDSYKQTTTECPTCRLFSFRSLDLIGNVYLWSEKLAPQNLMTMNCYAIFPTDTSQKPEIWIGGKYLPKMSSKTPFVVKDLTGGAAQAAMMDRTSSDLIIQIGIRRELWIRNLLISTPNQLTVATTEGTLRVDRTHWPLLKDAYFAMEKKARSSAIVLLRAITQGRISIASEKAQAFFQENPDFTQACMHALPVDPHARMFTLAALVGLEK